MICVLYAIDNDLLSRIGGLTFKQSQPVYGVMIYCVCVKKTI